MAEPFAYPPEHHVLRDLPFETEAVAEGHARAYLRAAPEACVNGVLAAGPLLTVVDLLAGSLAARRTAPDWVATASLTFHRRGEAPVGTTAIADARVLRAGSSTVVVEVGVDAGARRVGEAIVTFVRLPRRESVNPDLTAIEPRYGERTGFALPGSGLVEPFDDAIGVRAPGPEDDLGALEVPVTDYTRNSFGVMNGGVVASVAVAAARRAAAATATPPTPWAVDDIVVHYLGQGRSGPVVAVTEVGRVGPAGVSVRVTLRDAGLDRAMTVADVTLSPVAAG